MRKQIISMLLAILLVLSMVPVTAGAAEVQATEEIQQETVETPTETVLIVEPIEETVSSQVLLSETVQAQAGNGIIDSGSCGDGVTWMLAEDGVLTISGSGAMDDYSSWPTPAPWKKYVSEIKKATITGSVTYIGAYAFYGCTSLTDIDIPDCVTSIGNGAFGECSKLQEIIIPDSVTSIGGRAFYMCDSLTKVCIPNGVTSISDDTFAACHNLKEVSVPDSVTSIGAYAFYCCSSLEEVRIPEGVDSIKRCAFYVCAIKEISIPASVTSIGDNAFTGCVDMKDIYFQGDAPSFESNSFTEVTAIAHYDGDNATWTSDIMQDYGGRLTWIPYGGAIASGTCGENLTWELRDDGTLAIFGSGAMDNYNYSYDDNAVKAPWDSYKDDIYKVVISENVTSIGDEAFWYCNNLSDVLICESVTSIGNCAFTGCKNLKGVYFLGDAPCFDSLAFFNLTTSVYYPANNATWTSDIMENYYGSITWIPYIPEDSHEHSYKVDVIAATCTQQGYTKYTCTECGKTYTDTYAVPLEHDYQNGTCIRCGEVDPDYVYPEFESRISGKDRCATSRLVADTMMEELGVEKFDAILYTSGDNFADALAGSYLAVEKRAPILLYRASGAAANLEYIQANLSDGGTVYLLGGDAAVPADVETSLRNAGIHVERLSGKNRFLTNIAILNAAGFTGGEILVCTGYNFADSLSASAAGRPILLVKQEWTELNQDYVNYIDGLEGCTFTIIGGTGAVSAELAADLENYGTVDRVYGKTRYQTSVAVAERFIQDPESAVLAYAKNFPDGLCGGPLACLLGAPLILTDDINAATAAAYTKANGITEGIVLGGNILISDESANLIFGQ